MIETKFKNTEVGLIPEDWEVKTFEDICSTKSGGTPSREIKEFYNGSIPWVTTGELNDGDIYDTSEHISESALQNSSAKVFPSGTLLMAMYGATIGKLGITQVDAATNQACCAIFLKEDEQKYVFYKLLFDRPQLVAKGYGAGQPNISQSVIKKLQYAFPCKEEQSRIAAALSDIDDLIVTTKKLIEKKRNIKEGAIQELLSGKLRIKKFETEKNKKDTPFGEIPANWEIERIGDYFEFLPNNTLPREALSDNGVIKNVHYGDVLIKYGAIADVQIDDIPYISNSDFKPSYLIKDGDVIIADTAEDETVGKATEIVNVGDDKIVSGLHTIWLHPIAQGRYASGFLGYAFNASIYHNQLLPLMQGTKVTSISKNAIQETFLVIPPKPEQEAIVSTLLAMDSEIQSLESRLTKYQSLKHGMMQQLLTGKIRLI